MSNGLIEYKADENFGNGLVYSILEVEEVLKKKDDENRRYKRKRCLAMGAWCQANCIHTVLLIGHKIMPHWEWQIKTNYWYKWRKIWLELAEKFQGE